MSDSEPQLDNLSREFLAQLRRTLPTLAYHTACPDSLTVTIPARSAEVGDITVWLDPNEIAVEIGKLHHSHFGAFMVSAPTLAERERLAADMAVEYIRDIIEERVHFRVQLANGRVLGSACWYPERSDAGQPMSRADEIREYVWSHQLK